MYRYNDDGGCHNPLAASILSHSSSENFIFTSYANTYSSAYFAVLFSYIIGHIFFNLRNYNVHFSIGYHACRMLAASTDIATVIGTGIRENHEPDQIAAAAYQKIWGKQNRGQRDFQVCHIFVVVFFCGLRVMCRRFVT